MRLQNTHYTITAAVETRLPLDAFDLVHNPRSKTFLIFIWPACF